MPEALFMVSRLDSKGANVCKLSCRSRQELSNKYLPAKIGLDTAENGPLKGCQKITRSCSKVGINIARDEAALVAIAGDGARGHHGHHRGHFFRRTPLSQNDWFPSNACKMFLESSRMFGFLRRKARRKHPPDKKKLQKSIY